MSWSSPDLIKAIFIKVVLGKRSDNVKSEGWSNRQLL